MPVADELAPAADGPVLRGGRHPAGYQRRGALPEDAVGGRPAHALGGGLAVGQRQPAAVQRDVVVEHATGPAFGGAAELVGLGGRAIDEGVWTGGQIADGEIVPALFRTAAAKERLLPAGEERVPAIAAEFRYRRK